MLILNIHEHLYQKNLEKAFRLKMHLFRFFQAQAPESRTFLNLNKENSPLTAGT